MLVRSLTVVSLILSSALKLCAQPVLSYLIPDIGAPGMAVYVEFIAPNTADIDGKSFSTSDGVFFGNPGDPLRIELIRPEDSAKITFGPLVVSWAGRLISTIVFISPNASPNSWDWRQLTGAWRIPIRIRTPGGVTATDTFFIVQPTPGGDFRTRSETVLGRPPLGIRSRRGALLFDSLILGARTYTVATDDPDQNGTNGNQGYLPLVLMATGSIRGLSAAQTRISVDGNGSDGGPGGGGGGGEFCDIVGGGSNGGNGFTAGGRGGNNSPNSYRSTGVSTGPNGSSLNQTPGGTDGGAYESSGGGTGHPFGSSGSGCSSGPNCSPDGAYGGASGVSDNLDGAGGAYSSDGLSTSTGLNNGGKRHGDTTLIPLAGGSGGASGNPRNTSFPFSACGGRGGGGGGAIGINANTLIEHLTVTANGADGSGSGTTTSRRGGSGSGGGICLVSPLGISDVTVIAVGGGQSAPSGKGGNGRVRYDAPTATGFSAQPSPYRGPTLDTVSIAQGVIPLSGSGSPGKTIVLFVKPARGAWRIVDSTVVGANARWQYQLTPPPGTDFLYIIAAQREQQRSDRFAARPALVFSPASGRIVRILSEPLRVRPMSVDMGSISCAQGETKRDSIAIVNPGTEERSVTDAFFLSGTNGFRIVRPQPPTARIPAGDSVAFVIEYRIQTGRYGTQEDTLVLIGGAPPAPFALVPVRIRVDSAGIVLTPTTDTRAISAIDFAETCRSTSKELTHALRLVGTTPATIRRILTNTRYFVSSTLRATALAVGDTLHLRLRATPPDTGDYYDTLTIEIDLCNQTLRIPLHVRGLASQIIGIGDDGRGTVDFGSVRIGTSRTIRLGIINPSTSDSVILRPPQQPRSPYSWQTVPPGLPFPRSLRVRDTLWVDVTFTPTAMGIARDSIVFIAEQFGVTCTDTFHFTLVGVGTLSSVVPSKSLLDFGVVACGVRRDTLWLINTGNTEATIDFPATIIGSDSSYFRIIEQPPAGTSTLSPGDSLRIIIEVRIDPQMNEGIKTAVLIVNVRDATEPLQIPLQVQQQALALEFSPLPYILVDVPINFTSQSQPPLTVRNLSSIDACIKDIRTTRPEITPLIRSLTIPPYSSSRDIYFNIAPTTLNPIDDTITIVLSCPCVDSINIPIRIIPTNNSLSITPRPLDFGTVAPCSTVRRVLTLKNNDPASNAELEELTITGPDAELFRITGSPWSKLPYTVPSGFSFTIELEFNPIGTRAGSRSASLALRYVINGQEVNDTVQMIGERTVPFDADTLLDFGEIKQGESRTLPLRLTNNYTRSLTFSFGVGQWVNYYSVSPIVLNIDVVTKTSTADVEFSAQEIGEFPDTLWVKFTSLGMPCTDSIPVLLRARSLPGIGFALWLDTLRILDPRDKNVTLNIYAQLDTNLILPNVQLLLVLDLPNQLFMPRGVRARGGRILSFNSRTHDRHIITITVDTLLTPLSQQPQIIAQLIGDALLGDRQCDSIFIVQARWTNSGIKPTTWSNPGTGNGAICLTLCGAGGPRLLGSQLELPLFQIQPNPTTDDVTAIVTANERGHYMLEVATLDGTVITKHELGQLEAGRAYEVAIHVHHLAAGIYWVRLRSPRSIRSVPLVRIP